jgi:hypothetical protein
MPMDIWVDPDRQLRRAVGRDTLTDRDLLEAWGDVLADPAYDPHCDNLIDMSGVDSFQVTPLGAQRLADVMAMCAKPPAPGVRPRVAVVAPDDRSFGILRMYEVYRELQGAAQRFFVTRSVEEARCWLALPRVETVEGHQTAG